MAAIRSIATRQAEAAASQKYQHAEDPAHPIVVVPFEAFAHHDRLPEFGQVAVVPVKSLEGRRSKCVILFVSHRWRNPGGGGGGGGGDNASAGRPQPHPDPRNETFPLVVAAVRQVARTMPKDCSCFIWLDFCCVDLSAGGGGGGMSTAAAATLRSLPAIVERCDCVLVPYTAGSTLPSSAALAVEGAALPSAAAVAEPAVQKMGPPLPRAPVWVAEYPDINAWAGQGRCLMEVMLCGLTPPPPGRFRHALWTGPNTSERPLLLYGPHQQREDSPPQAVPLPPLSWFQLEGRNPFRAALREESERPVVARVLEALAMLQLSKEAELLRVLCRDRDAAVQVLVDVYEGEEDELGRPHGFGNMIYADGEVYSGQWAAGRRHGDGTLTGFGPDGDRYQGGWADDVRSGQGVHSGPEGVYEGCWRDDAREGLGVLRLRNGDTFEGRFATNKRVEGTHIYSNGDMYVGPFVDGKREGTGAITEAGGTVYEGGWRGDNKHGQGYARFPDGAEFVGQFQYGMMHGRGRWTYPDGAVYEGDWRKNHRHGNGLLRPAKKGKVVPPPIRQVWDDGNLVREVREKTKTTTSGGCGCAVA